ncbi:unnamed protein product [Echinostoma caproni]|uniref:Phosphatidylinositol-glycan biosynthesis class W protein n=1 Tax=Echinostoma caproni TaxID=27848 RepID=A0A183A0E6_9TREM|nr:unnamed protein product [Echinostoma caproni]
MDRLQKEEHEMFTQQIGYQSVPEILCISVCPFILLFIRDTVVTYFGLNFNRLLRNLLFDFFCVVCPVIFLLTIAADHAIQIVILFGVLAFSLCFVKLSRRSLTGFTKLDFVQSRDKATTVLLLSCLMIMLIDLPICPRRFAKNSTYGLGLMDVGTGLFLASSSIAGSKALFNLSEGTKFWYTVKRIVLPSLILGLVRFLSVSFLGYQSVVEEYGVHWNFFVTFALVRLASALICTPCIGKLSKTARTIVCFITGLSFCILSHAIHIRVKPLIQTNAEGLLSLPGYLSIYFLCLGCYHACRQLEHSRITASSKAFYFTATHTFLVLTSGSILYQLGMANISRRFASPGYVLFILFMLCFCTSFSWLLRVLSYSISQGHCQPSALSLVVSSQGMFYFLVCNLVTGLVNFVYNTVRFVPSDTFSSLFSLLTGILHEIEASKRQRPTSSV